MTPPLATLLQAAASVPPLWAVFAATLLASLGAATAVTSWMGQRGRRDVLARLAQRPRLAALRPLGADDVDPFAVADAPAWQRTLAAVLSRVIPARLRGADVREKLAQAGIYAPAAPLYFAAGRVVAPVVMPLLVVAATGSTTPMALALGLAVGVAGPPALLDRRAGTRRTALTLAIPDALDLLIVCLEAGVGIDAALVRVARELAPTHPLLSTELEDVTRRISAGLPRDEALRALVTRTGVEDLRSIVSTMIQAERLGTSLARVLRIHGEALRTRRRQLAEKKAAEASVKMVIPLVLFLLPAFFTIVLGPAVLSMMSSAKSP